jgi:hypothetical protein
MQCMVLRPAFFPSLRASSNSSVHWHQPLLAQATHINHSSDQTWPKQHRRDSHQTGSARVVTAGVLCVLHT